MHMTSICQLQSSDHHQQKENVRFETGWSPRYKIYAPYAPWKISQQLELIPSNGLIVMSATNGRTYFAQTKVPGRKYIEKAEFSNPTESRHF